MSQSEVSELSDREAKFSLIFLGGDADQARLDLYDDAVSLGGFARTLAIIGHFYITGDIIAHAPKSKLQLYAVSSEEGVIQTKYHCGCCKRNYRRAIWHFCKSIDR